MNPLRKIFLLLSPFLLIVSGAANAELKFSKQQLTQHFATLGVSVLDVQPAPIDGLLEVTTNQGVLFSSPDGKQFIAGTLYAQNEKGNYVDVLAERQAPLNAKKLDAAEESMITFKADKEKYVITVFTDTSCPYCVRLHRQMKGYNDLGITVRYVAYPRQGPQSRAAQDLANIWCAEDQNKAMDSMKNNNAITTNAINIAQCQQTITDHYMLGRDLGITGTPAIFMPNGKLISGYVPPAGIYQRLVEM